MGRSHRWMIAAALTGAAGLAVAGQMLVRTAEAALGAGLSRLIVPGIGPVRVTGTDFALWAGTTREQGFSVAGICTVAPFLAAAFLLAAGIVLLDQRTAPARMLRLAAAVGLFLLAANTLRITIIVACIRLLGHPTGYTLGHKVIGTLLLLAVFAVSLTLLTRPVLTAHHPNPQHPTEPP